MNRARLSEAARAALKARFAEKRAAQIAREIAEASAMADAAAPIEPAPEAASEAPDHDADDADAYKVGYCRPPLDTRWSKGTSGCPDGGHTQRRANKAAREKAEKLERKNKKIIDEVQELFEGPVKITIDGVEKEVSQLTSLVYRDQAAAASDPKIRERQIRLAERLGLLKRSAAKEQVGVVVVSPPMTKEEWLKKAQAARLPLNPLEGLPGIDKDIDRTVGRRGETLDDDQT